VFLSTHNRPDEENMKELINEIWTMPKEEFEQVLMYAVIFLVFAVFATWDARRRHYNRFKRKKK
jgi:vancomycin permeability regulator SanA